MVRIPDIPTMWAPSRLTFSIKVAGGTSIPRSLTSKPALRARATKMFFPMSCRSPSTVPTTILPSTSRSPPVSASRAGSRISIDSLNISAA